MCAVEGQLVPIPDKMQVSLEESFRRMNLETAVETHVQVQDTEPTGFSTAPQFTKTVNSSMASG